MTPSSKKDRGIGLVMLEVLLRALDFPSYETALKLFGGQ